MKTVMAQFILLGLVGAAMIPAVAYANEIKVSPPHIVVPKVNTGGKTTGVDAGNITVKKGPSGIAEYRAGGDPVETRKASRTYNGVTLKRGVAPNQNFQQWQQGVSGSGSGGVYGPRILLYNRR